MKQNVSQKLFSVAKNRIGELIIGLAFGAFPGALPVKKIKETGKVVAFYHPRPSYQKHILIVPKKRIKSLAAVRNEDAAFLTEIFKVAKEIVREQRWDRYRLICNGGEYQKVKQLHVHLVSG